MNVNCCIPPAEREEGALPPLTAVFRMMAAKPEFRHMIIGLALVTMVMFGSGAFYAPFFMRAHGLSLSEVGVYYAVQSGIAATAGLAIAGFGIDLISKRGARWYALLPALGVLLSVPFNLIGYSASNPLVALIFLICGAILAFFHNVPTLVAFQNMVGPRMRATAAFVFFFVTTLVGVGVGPAVLGFISDLYANALFDGGSFSALCHTAKGVPVADALQAACTKASTTGIRYALLTSTIVAAWSALHYYLASCAIVKAGR